MASAKKPPAHHSLFYFDYGTYIFQVEDTLYKLYHPVLVEESICFANLFDVGSHGPDTTEGKLDEHPIHLEGVSTDVFDMFVQFKFGRPRPCEAYTNKDLKDFLEFTRKFQCSSFTRDFVISRIKQRHYRFHPSELVHIGINYEIPDIFTLGFNRLVQTPWTDIENTHRDFMGSEVFTTLVYVKALLDEHCRIVAAEPPTMRHAPNCPDKKACAEDWRAVWWNGMGRLLLDARNPQPFDEAFERFQLLEFGRVGDDCKKVMFTQILSINLPRIHATKFVDNVRDRLVKKLIPC